jgi:mRNA interferase MazF
MAATIKTAISIKKTLFDQAEILAQELNISRSHLFGIALENFIKNVQSQAPLDEINKTCENQPDLNEREGSLCQDAKTKTQTGRGQMVINQGDIYWVQLEEPGGLEPGIAHPYVVLQDNVFTRSRIHSVVVCALTSNIKQANAPGNVLLEGGEANLPRQSVVVVSKISAVDKTQLGEYIGSLTHRRINQILAGMQFLQLITEHHEAGEKKEGYENH